jgi:hypothetical protein
MKKLRMFVAAALALSGAGTLAAQAPSPPPPGLYPSVAPAVDPAAVAGPPAVVVGDNASPNVPKLWFYLGLGATWVTPTPNPSPLLTTSTLADAGVIGAPSTTVLLGQQTINYGTFGTISFGTGGWWNEDRTIGSDGMTSWSEQKSASAFFASDQTGTPALFRPIIDPVLQAETSVPVALPGAIIGSFLFQTSMRINNGDSNLLLNFFRDETRAWTALVGYRLMYIREEMDMIETQILLADNAVQVAGTPLLAGDTVTIGDRIETVNRYYLPQVGLRWDRYFGAFALTATAKFGLGWSDQRIYGDGRTSVAGNPQAIAGGVLVQQSFPYRNHVDRLAFVPDLGVVARVRIANRLYLAGSYNFTYISDVARPGKYFDRVIEQSQMPTSPQFTGVVGTRPTFLDHQTSDMVVNAVRVGLVWAY